jgi:acetyl-CoA carboxylase carboxyl transferase subunit beta
MAGRVDVSIEHRDGPDADGGQTENTCPACSSHYRDDELERALWVCAHCGHHFRVRAWDRIAQLADRGTFVEDDPDIRSADPLEFFDLRPYRERLAKAEVDTQLGDAMVAGQAKIERRDCQLAVMDFAFMGGSMGSAVGEKFARACEHAVDRHLPLVCVTSSGGARMQEGILALMQMPKTISSVDLLQESRSAFVVVLAHPTTGGVLASFASLGDIIVAEPGTLMSFAGPRVVQQVTREKLPDDFGLAEPNLRYGHIDAIVERRQLKLYLGRVLALFVNGG